VDAHGRKRQCVDLPLLSGVRLHVYWTGEGFPGYVAVAIGAFGDPAFPAPTIAVWEECRHPWVTLPADTPPKRVAKQG
jgi:hypothetical protein